MRDYYEDELWERAHRHKIEWPRCRDCGTGCHPDFVKAEDKDADGNYVCKDCRQTIGLHNFLNMLCGTGIMRRG